MSQNNINVAINERGIAIVTLDRADKLNAITIPMLQEMQRVARKLQTNPTVRAIVLHGEGNAFSSGLDFADVQEDKLAIPKHFVPRPWRGTNTFQEGPWCWRRVDVPVIAAIEGYCLGAGLQIALAADYRFTTAEAKWSILEAKWGLVPDMSGLAAMRQVVRGDILKRLCMTAEMFTGEQAVAWGIASEVSANPLESALELAERIADRSPDAVANAKKLVDETWTTGLRATFFYERIRQMPLLVSANAAVSRKRAAVKGAANGEATGAAGGELPAYRPRRKRILGI